MLGGFVKRGYAVRNDYGRFGAARIPAYLVGVGEGRSALDIMVPSARSTLLSERDMWSWVIRKGGTIFSIFYRSNGPDYAPE